MVSRRKSIRLTVPIGVYKHLALISLTYNIPLMKVYEICLVHAASCNYFHDRIQRMFDADFQELLEQNIQIKPLRLTDTQINPYTEKEK